MIYHIHLIGKPNDKGDSPTIEKWNHSAPSDEEAIRTAVNLAKNVTRLDCYGFLLSTQDGKVIHSWPNDSSTHA